MAYNFRKRIRLDVVEKEDESLGGEASSDEDNVSIHSNTDTSSSDYSDAEDIENTSLNERIMTQSERSRGRPVLFRSKNNRKWNTKERTRTSGK